MPVSRLKRYRLSTLYLRVPRQDWPAVKRGLKTEYRMAGRHASPLINVITPTPVVVWCPVRYGPEPEQQLMVLLDVRMEPLGAISPESLAREGFETRKEFVDYWRHRGNGGRVDPRAAFKPLTQVWVYHLRPWVGGDLEELGPELLRRLYRGHLDEAE